MPNPFKAIWKGLKAAGKGVAKVDDVIDSIPMADKVLVAIPVAGPVLASVFNAVDVAQAMIPEDGGGEARRELAKKKAREELEKLGFEEEFVNEVVALAFLLRKGKAGIVKEE